MYDRRTHTEQSSVRARVDRGRCPPQCIWTRTGWPAALLSNRQHEGGGPLQHTSKGRTMTDTDQSDWCHTHERFRTTETPGQCTDGVDGCRLVPAADLHRHPHPPKPSPSESLLRFFTYEHLPSDLRPVSQACADLATWMQATLPDGPEKTTGLRKLLEAKDCFVRAALPTDE